MKLLHISDLHLDSPLTSHLSPAKIVERRRELSESFRRAVEYGIKEGVYGVLIAGDLFDHPNPSSRVQEAVTDVIRRYPEVRFFYIAGNHEEEKSVLSRDLPNLTVFGEHFSSAALGDVMIYGRSHISKEMLDELSLDQTKKNIVMLHGELTEGTTRDGVIGIGELAGRGIDYLALGHYHTYSEKRIDARGIAVYAGTPEGRGFDECGQKGVVIIDTESFSHRFVPLCLRTLHEIKTDISECPDTSACEVKIEKSLQNTAPCDLVRVRLVGKTKLFAHRDLGALKIRFQEKFYYFELHDESTLAPDIQALAHDKSLGGEFIRLVLADSTLSEEERRDIIDCGLSALRGEGWIHE